MDKRKLLPGGEIGISSNEINLMPQANRDGMFGINDGIVDGADMIISGVDAIINAGSDVSVSDGFVFLNGEMLKVDAQVVSRTVGTDLYQFTKVTTSVDPNGERNFRDSTTGNVYENNRAVPTNVASITGLSVVGNTMLDVMKSLIRVQSDWNQADNAQPDYIKNKPNVIDILVQGKFDIGQIGFAPVGTLYTVSGGITSAQKTIDGTSQEVISVSFPNVGTSSYQVLVELISLSSNHLNDNDTTFAVYNKTSTSFQFSIAGIGGNEFIDVVITLIPLDLT